MDGAVKEISGGIVCSTALSGNEGTRSLVVYEVLRHTPRLKE